MADTKFRLAARVSSASPETIFPVLEKTLGRSAVTREDGEFRVEASMMGPSAKDLNRSLLSALRRAEKRTRLRAEWTTEDGTTYRFFDYVLKKTVHP